jgi:transposase
LDDYIAEDNPVRVVEVFVNELDLGMLGFDGVDPAPTGRPAYHPAVLLKLYIYGYLNRIQSSRRLERETQRNVELMWLTGRLAPDFNTIAAVNGQTGRPLEGLIDMNAKAILQGRSTPRAGCTRHNEALTSTSWRGELTRQPDVV